MRDLQYSTTQGFYDTCFQRPWVAVKEKSPKHSVYTHAFEVERTATTDTSRNY